MKKAICIVAVVAIGGIVIAGLAKANGVDFIQVDPESEEMKFVEE